MRLLLDGEETYTARDLLKAKREGAARMRCQMHMHAGHRNWPQACPQCEALALAMYPDEVGKK